MEAGRIVGGDGHVVVGVRRGNGCGRGRRNELWAEWFMHGGRLCSKADGLVACEFGVLVERVRMVNSSTGVFVQREITSW
jgi:hypothetical protein